ncbi:hypothetical protein [Enterobacter roggenkampii]|uniref:glycine-rich domain-containing protein n=1 Tax=Enterobacter roggenkampii TaxID=1812935 RepID=UPI0009421BB0|nr:hypothetical protein [Enterobacter roggenkampii]
MHRIDTPTAQKDKFGAGKNGFTRGNPQTGTPATELDDDYFDMLQEELATVVEATGVALDKAKRNQLLTALNKLFPTTGRLLNVQTFTSSGTYTPTPGTKFVVVEVQGGGGGSGGLAATGSSTGAASGGGSAGAYAMAKITSEFSGVSITIGAKGYGGAPGVNNGSQGGNSSFGSHVVAPGGPGGIGGPAGSPPIVGYPGAQSSEPTGGNIVQYPGAAASSSLLVSLSSPIFGPGGSSRFGSGQRGNSSSLISNAIGYGVGGGGSVNGVSAAALVGSNGSQGIVIVWEYAE